MLSLFTGNPVEITVGDTVNFDGFNVGEEVGPDGFIDGNEVGFDGFTLGEKVGPVGRVVGGKVGFLENEGACDIICTVGFRDGFDVGIFIIVGY